MAFVLLFELVANMVILTISIWAVVAFLRRERIFPFVFVLLGAGGIAVQIVDLLLVSRVGSSELSTTAKDVGAVMGSIISLAVWGTYVVRSKRVHRTFVR